MNEEQLKMLMDWVETKINLRIEEAFGRDPVYEWGQELDAREALLNEFKANKG